MLELAEILGYGQQDFLNEVVRVAVLNVVSSQPRPNQRRIEIRQPIPTLVFWGVAEAFEKTKRGFMHLGTVLSPCIIDWQDGPRQFSSLFP